MTNLSAVHRFRHSPIGIIILSLLVLPLASCKRTQYRPEELKQNQFFAEILRREDSRSIDKDGFFQKNLQANPYPKVRIWCALALGRMGSPKALPWLYQAVRSGDASVRAASAFAIGEIQDRELLAEQFLSLDIRAVEELARLLDDPSLPVQMRAVEALGKIGMPSEAAGIIKKLEHFSYDSSPSGRAFLHFSIAALAKLKNPASMPVIEKLAQSSDPEIQWRAASALVSLQDKNARSLFLRLLKSPDPKVQSQAALGLGICEDPSLASMLLHLLPPRQQRINPLSVRFCALTALGSLKNPIAIPYIRAALEAAPIDNAPQLNFAIYAANTLGNIGAAEGEAALLPLTAISGPVANNATIALAKILKGKPERFFNLMDARRFTSPEAMQVWAKSMAELGGTEAVNELYRMLPQSAPSFSKMQAETLSTILASLAKLDPPGLQEILLPLFGSSEAALLRTAVEAYKPAPGAKTPWDPIAQALAACAADKNLETRIAILKHLTPWIHEDKVQEILSSKLNDPEHKIRMTANGLLRQAGAAGLTEGSIPEASYITEATSYVLAANRNSSAMAILETARGNIEIELFAENAPITTAYFILSANQGVYNGMTIARTIPISIIEGGDYPGANRITSRAGRNEINMRPFERGSVGIALSDKGLTPGHFFIALAPQPQFDGVHACFGRVISGMQILEQMTPGDRIKRVQIRDDYNVFSLLR